MRLTFKTPDVVGYAVEEYRLDPAEIGPDEVTASAEAIRRACAKWVQRGEYLTVEVDTDKGTCVVVPV